MKPSKPFCDECLQIVQKPKPIDILYVNLQAVLSSSNSHPHLGAYDSNGTNLGQYLLSKTSLHMHVGF
jgi:hypothetical protein